MSAVDPGYYKSDGMECADALRAMLYGLDITNVGAYWLGCALKYMWRHPYKNGVEDIDKAIECLKRYRAEEYGIESGGGVDIHPSAYGMEQHAE